MSFCSPIATDSGLALPSTCLWFSDIFSPPSRLVRSMLWLWRRMSRSSSGEEGWRRRQREVDDSLTGLNETATGRLNKMECDSDWPTWRMINNVFAQGAHTVGDGHCPGRQLPRVLLEGDGSGCLVTLTALSRGARWISGTVLSCAIAEGRPSKYGIELTMGCTNRHGHRDQSLVTAPALPPGNFLQRVRKLVTFVG